MRGKPKLLKPHAQLGSGVPGLPMWWTLGGVRAQCLPSREPAPPLLPVQLGAGSSALLRCVLLRLGLAVARPGTAVQPGLLWPRLRLCPAGPPRSLSTAGLSMPESLD